MTRSAKCPTTNHSLHKIVYIYHALSLQTVIWSFGAIGPQRIQTRATSVLNRKWNRNQGELEDFLLGTIRRIARRESKRHHTHTYNRIAHPSHVPCYAFNNARTYLPLLKSILIITHRLGVCVCVCVWGEDLTWLCTVRIWLDFNRYASLNIGRV